MKHTLYPLSLAALTIILSGCSSLPETCTEQLDCGYGAYSEERTVLFEGPKTPAPVVEEVKEEVVKAPEPVKPTPAPEPAPIIEPEPAPVMEPIESKADKVFDERLHK